MFGCKHLWNKLEGSVQYCSKCGIARQLPCKHEWEIIEQMNLLMFGSLSGKRYILQCKHCGKLDDYEV